MGHNKKINKYSFDGRLKRKDICKILKWDDYVKGIKKMYVDDKMSGHEIAEYINQNTPDDLTITPRSISRELKKLNLTRPIKEAFNNAIDRGRVKWAYKELKIKKKQLSPKLRYSILKRDDFKCVLCGATAKDDLLEVDHIKAICKGGLSTPENLRTTCYSCNNGKRIVEKER